MSTNPVDPSYKPAERFVESAQVPQNFMREGVATKAWSDQYDVSEHIRLFEEINRLKAERMKPGSKGPIATGNFKLLEVLGECFAGISHLEAIDGRIGTSGVHPRGMARDKTCSMGR